MGLVSYFAITLSPGENIEYIGVALRFFCQPHDTLFHIIMIFMCVTLLLWILGGRVGTPPVGGLGPSLRTLFASLQGTFSIGSRNPRDKS